MNDHPETHEFRSRKEFRDWLIKNHQSPDGIWIVFTKGSKEFTANDALEEAICFGWIDGLLKSMDATRYRKYFSQRKNKAKWSDKNKSIYTALVQNDLMTEHGIKAFKVLPNEIEKNSKNEINTNNVYRLKDALRNDNDVLKLFEGLSPSRQKQLAGFYCDAKTEETRTKRKSKIAEAIKTNNKGMLY